MKKDETGSQAHSMTDHGVGAVEGAEMQDIAAALYAEGQSMSPEELAAEKLRVRSILDWRIMPIVSR